MPEPKRVMVGFDTMRWGRALRCPVPLPVPLSDEHGQGAAHGPPALRTRRKPPLVHALYRAAWADDRDLADDAELAAVAASGLGLDGAALVAGTRSEPVKARLKDATDEAQRAGLCGAPSFLVGDLLFWGQDRPQFVERALQGWRPRGE